MLAGATCLAEARVPAYIEYWPYALERAGGLDRLNDIIQGEWGQVADIGFGQCRSEARPAGEIDAVAASYDPADPHAATNLLLLPREVRCRPPPSASRQISGQRALEPKLLPAHGMLEPEPALWRNCRSIAELPLAAVARVRHQRLADRGEVRPDLVGAPRLEPHAHERERPEPLLYLEVRARVACAAAADGAPLGSPEVAAQGRVDRPRARARAPWISARYSRSTCRSLIA